MATKLSISFKNNTKETKLYNFFNNLEDKSNEMKKILAYWYENNVNSEKITSERKEESKEEIEKVDIDITDF